jgi:hypothetical protein
VSCVTRGAGTAACSTRLPVRGVRRVDRVRVGCLFGGDRRCRMPLPAVELFAQDGSCVSVFAVGWLARCKSSGERREREGPLWITVTPG